MKKEFMAIILGSDDNAYGFARVFHEKYNIIPIALATSLLEVCKNSKIIDVQVDPKLHDLEHFIEVLNELGVRLEKEYEKLVIIPCSDLYMELLSKSKGRLKYFENEFIDYETLKKFNDKESFYKMCEKYGLPYPKSIICNKKNYKSMIKKIDFTYPIILKPNNSNSESYLKASFEGKNKVYFIDDEKSLLENIENIYSSTYQDDLIIQEYVNGNDSCMRVLNVYSDKNGKVRVMSLGKPILEEYHPKTYGNYAAIISIPGMNEIMEKIKVFLEKIEYKGASNFDIKIDSKTKKYYVFEINPRPGRSSFFSTCAGASIACAYIDDLVKNKPVDHLGNKSEILWMNLPYSLLKRYVDKDILGDVKALQKKHKVYHTLKYEKDSSLKRKSIVSLQYLRKLHYFPKYFIDKK